MVAKFEESSKIKENEEEDDDNKFVVRPDVVKYKRKIKLI